MDISNEHNLTAREHVKVQRFGIRLGVPPEDPFARLVGTDWHAHHWFATREERDAALQEMASRHRYSRRSDAPSIVLEPVER
jgi:hypothetical protein